MGSTNWTDQKKGKHKGSTDLGDKQGKVDIRCVGGLGERVYMTKTCFTKLILKE